ncbi:MAG: hypothetical protein LBG87_01385, partial [Spirochaetaceae bacterium]|nr:hypothetical protein [Spirochaetaceae bacterium]
MFYAFRAIVDGQKITLAESNPVEGIYEAVVILTTPLKKDIVSPASQPASPQSIPQAVILEKSSSATQPRLPANRAAPAGIVSAGQGAPAAGNLSPLYLDKAKRDAR